MKKFLTYISRHLHIFFWRITGKTDDYIKVQVASSHNTRENTTVQKNIAVALDKLYPLLEDHNAKILDAGCGDGWTMDQFRDAGYPNIWGIDINDNKLNTAKKHGHANVAKTLLPEIPFEDDFFDIIFCRHVYEHLLYPKKTLESFYRILKPKGKLFIIAPKSEINADSNESHTVNIVIAEDISKLMQSEGFKIILKEEHFLEELEFWVIGTKKC